MDSFTLLVIIIVLAFIFDYINGFHYAANSIATIVATRVLTPFDREDIHSLMKSIDDVTDFLHGSASRMKMYQVEKITKSIRKLTEINLESCQLIQRAIIDLKEQKNLQRITVACKKISKLESKADVVFDNAVMDIFENETDAIKIIKYKEVLTALEDASDKCKDVANVLETIVVKYS